jgi:hypothetical protein
MPHKLRYSRILVEAVVIVGSILLAFGIQALWDNRQDEQQVRWGLEGILAELEVVQGLSTEVGMVHRRMLTTTRSLQSLLQVRDLSQPLAVPDTLLAGLFGVYISDHPTAMAEAFIAAGYLDEVQDDVLRRALPSWLAQVDDQRADETRASDFYSFELGPYLREEFDVVRAQVLFSGFFMDGVGLASSSGGTASFTSVRADMRLRNLVGQRLLWLELLVQQKEDLLSELEDLTLSLSEEIRLH